MHIRHVPLLLVVGLAASGCAGLPLPEETATASPAPENVATDVIDLTNQERLRNGLKALITHSQLTEAARLHAEQMAARQQLAHTISGAQYPTMQSRLQAVGYAYANAAENVAWNQRGAREVVDTWMRSSGHRANILDPNLTEIGVAMARSSKGEPYWIQVFGRPR